MDTILIFSCIILAGFLQGSFILPMTMVNNWKWENTWFVFSFFGMVALNLLLAFIFINNLQVVYLSAATKDIFMLCIFGFGWGFGAVLFGIGMEKLGMALGYPIIMGLIASIGGLLPMFVLHSSDAFKPSGLIMIAGTIIVVVGIIICSKAASLRSSENKESIKKIGLSSGLIIAVAAGLLSCLPNIGFSFGTGIKQTAIAQGTSPAMAENAVWALFFSIGFVPNFLYTCWLMIKNKTLVLFTQKPVRNIGLGLLMSIMWIGSFYIYGYSSSKLSNWGNIIGWPLFITISIVVGNILGIWRGEWKESPIKAKRLLNIGLATLMLAMVILGISHLF